MDRILNFYDMVKDSVCTQLLNHIPEHYKYHSLRHTLDVIEVSVWIGQAEDINENDLNLLKIAALFHDTGYLRSRKNHEQFSCEIFREMVKTFDFSEHEKGIIEGCIIATTIPQRPNNLLEQILCDADLDYLGRDDFEEIAELLFLELHGCGEIKTREEWNSIQVKFLDAQSFHTNYSKTTRLPRLHQNLTHLKKMMHT